MLNSFYILCQICVFTAKPQNLPSSRSFLISVIITNIVVFSFGYSILPIKVNPFLLTFAHLFLLGVLWYVILQLMKKTDRWEQSASALFGTSTIMSLVSFPVLISNMDLLTGAPPESISISLLAIFIIRIWELIVIATILRETLEIKIGAAVAMSFGMTMVIELILISFLGLGK